MVYMECFSKISLSILFFCATAFAETFQGPTNLTLKSFDELTVNGPAHLHLIKAQNLKINGTLQFSRLEVAKEAVIHGPVTGDHGKFGSLEVNGPVDASYLIVHGPTKIQGPLHLQFGELNELHVAAEEITLDSVKAAKVVIGKSGASQILILQGGTDIKGEIIFESGNGILIKKDAASKFGGPLQGGTIQQP